mgnify:CR=1 FL=1
MRVLKNSGQSPNIEAFFGEFMKNAPYMRAFSFFSALFYTTWFLYNGCWHEAYSMG